MTSNDVNSMI